MRPCCPSVFSLFLATLTLFLLPAQAIAADQTDAAATEILSEIRVGALRHDAGVIVGQREQDAVDANLELLFASPGFLKYVWSPRPHLGVTANASGDTSQAYLGLTWDIDLFGNLFFELGLGASVHNGEKDTGDPARRNLGCRWLFHESVSLGYRISEHHDISVMLDHASNNDRCEENEGIHSLGIRWGYRFSPGSLTFTIARSGTDEKIIFPAIPGADASGLTKPQVRFCLHEIAIEDRAAGGGEEAPHRDIGRDIGLGRSRESGQDDGAEDADRPVRRDQQRQADAQQIGQLPPGQWLAGIGDAVIADDGDRRLAEQRRQQIYRKRRPGQHEA